MTVVARPPLAEGPTRLFTAADLAAMPSELPSGPVIFELDNGRLVTMAPPGAMHGKFESNIDTQLKIQGEFRGLGKVFCGDVGIILWQNPDRVVGADAVFISIASLPLRLSSEGYLETITDLAVEVRSKNDTQHDVEQKIKDYLRAGVRVVWDVDPGKHAVTAYRRDQAPHIFTEADTLTVEDVIPGFQMAVRDVFQL